VLCAVPSVLEIRIYTRTGSVLTLATAAVVALLAGLMALGLWNYARPVLEISEDAIRYGPIMGLRRRCISGGDVEGIVESTRRRVVLKARAGRPVTIWLRYVRKGEREAARQAIERWVAEHAGREA
jgi:hypothetical protein